MLNCGLQSGLEEEEICFGVVSEEFTVRLTEIRRGSVPCPGKPEHRHRERNMVSCVWCVRTPQHVKQS